jgi:hypothetical protein
LDYNCFNVARVISSLHNLRERIRRLFMRRSRVNHAILFLHLSHLAT